MSTGSATTTAPSVPMFGNARVLLYNVDPWARFGFGVANFGSPSQLNPGTVDTVCTFNQKLWTLADEIGQLQLFTMTHIDARRRQPPSINTVRRIARMLNRVHNVLAARMRDYPDQRIEPIHQDPAPLVWNIHPVPYFAGPFVRNNWLAEYNALVMCALTNLYQHSDNNLPFTVTVELATQVYQYFGEIKRMLGVELLGLDLATVTADTFVFDDTMFANYHPDQVTINVEALDGPGDLTAMPTGGDLRVLMRGIPADEIYPLLRQYPVVPAMAGADVAGQDTLDQTKTASGTGGIGGAGSTDIGPGLGTGPAATNAGATSASASASAGSIPAPGI